MVSNINKETVNYQLIPVPIYCVVNNDLVRLFEGKIHSRTYEITLKVEFVSSIFKLTLTNLENIHGFAFEIFLNERINFIIFAVVIQMLVIYIPSSKLYQQ